MHIFVELCQEPNVFINDHIVQKPLWIESLYNVLAQNLVFFTCILILSLRLDQNLDVVQGFGLGGFLNNAGELGKVLGGF